MHESFRDEGTNREPCDLGDLDTKRQYSPASDEILSPRMEGMPPPIVAKMRIPNKGVVDHAGFQLATKYACSTLSADEDEPEGIKKKMSSLEWKKSQIEDNNYFANRENLELP